MDEISHIAGAEREALISAFAAVLRKNGKDLASFEKAYLNQILEDLELEELPDLSTADFNRAIAGFWAYGAHRPNVGQTLRRIHPFTDARGEATAYDVVEIIQADQPFIVETVMGELIEQGVSVRSMFHPVVNVWRDAQGLRQDTDGAGKTLAESMMLVFIERLSPEKHGAILAGLDESLNDLKLAVLDFPRMQRLLAEEIADLESLRTHVTVQLDPALLEEDIAFLKWLDENRFVFIGARGYQYPRSDDGAYAREEPLNQLQEGFGILRDAKRGVLRRSSEPAVLTQQVLDQLVMSEPRPT
jgi:glutamate dehydrogenase